MALSSETVAAICKWCDDNPYTVYADYRDELSEDVVRALLEGDREPLHDLLDEVGMNALDYADWDDLFADMARDLKLGDLDEDDEEEAKDILRENLSADTWGWAKSAANNTRLHFTAMPYVGEPGQRLFEEDQDERLFLFPHAYCGEEENERRATMLRANLGILFPEEAETCYEFDTLKVIGRIDIADLLEEGVPTHITFGPNDSDNLFTHNEVNGSGGLGTIKLDREVTFPAVFKLDSGNRYGVDAVYGLVGEVWAKPLRWTREEVKEAA